MTIDNKKKRTLPTFVWVIILAVILLNAVAASLIIMNTGNGYASVGVYVKGECIARLLLNTDQTVRINTDEGYNIVEVKDGKVHIAEADCPEQTCVQSGWVSGSMMPIVCLPHQLIVRCEHTVPDPGEPDIIAY